MHQLPQERHLVEVVGAREGRQPGRDQPQVERRGPSQLDRGLDRAGVAGEPAALLGTGPQVGRGGGRQPAVELVEAAPGAHRRQRRGEGPVERRGVVHVVGGHHPHPGPDRQLGQGIVAGAVEGVAVVPQLHPHPVAAEALDEAAELARRRRGPLVLERLRHRPLAAPGEEEGNGTRAGTAELVDELVERQAGRALLARELGQAQGAAQRGVARRAVGEHHQVPPRRVGSAHHRVVGAVEGDLGAEDRGQADLRGGLGEAHHAVEAVVVGECQGLEAEPGGLLGQRLGRRGAVEEAEVRVGVELGVGHGGRAGARAGA